MRDAFVSGKNYKFSQTATDSVEQPQNPPSTAPTQTQTSVRVSVGVGRHRCTKWTTIITVNI